MNETKHTPGPWKQRGAGPNSGRDIWNEDGSMNIAQCLCDGQENPYNFPMPDLNEAFQNARLIAAAPDHHQNAIWADNIFSVFANNPAFREVLDAFGHCQTFDDWMKSNRATIAKAEGKE